jgi:cytochrome P450
MKRKNAHSLGGAKNLAPGPRGHWLWGNYLDHRDRPLEFYLQSHQQYGDVVRYRLGPFVGHGVYHPDIISEVLHKKMTLFDRSRGHDMIKNVLGQGLITSSGEEWKKQRTEMQPQFGASLLQNAIPQIADEAEKIAARLHKKIRGGGPSHPSGDHAASLSRGENRAWHQKVSKVSLFEFENPRQGVSIPVDKGFSVVVHDWMLETSMAMASNVLFGVQWAAKEIQSLRQNLQRLNEGLRHRVGGPHAPMWVPTPSNVRFRRTRQQFVKMVSDRVLAPGASKGLLSPIVDRVLQIPNRRRQQVVLDGLIMTMFIAASDTTALGLVWALWHLAKNPTLQERARREAQAQWHKRGVDAHSISQMPYLAAIMKEAWRLHPPVWLFSRLAAQNEELGGYHIPKGSDVLIVPYVVHRDPRFWSDPETFNPERFLVDGKPTRPPTAYIPFGLGPRHCIGFKLAEYESVVILAALLKQFEVSSPSADLSDVDAKLLLNPKPGMTLQFAHR